MHRLIIAIVFLLALFVAGSHGKAEPPSLVVAPPEGPALSEALHDLCDRRFALLGEGPTHGDGATEAFKVALVERLVDQCGFRSVIFEASQYEFFALDRRLAVGLPVSPREMAEAVGGLRRSDQELQPLLTFLLDRARTGRVYLSGLDDQLGGSGDFYANDRMIPELTATLPSPRRAECIEAFRRKAYFDYPDASPYSSADHEQLLGCLDEMERANRTARNDVNSPPRSQMIQGLRRYIGRDQAAYRDQWQARDDSMFNTLNWLVSHDYVRGKAIIWGATVHLAKRDPDPKTGDLWSNFGLLMHASFGDQAFVVGFSALAGSYRVNHHLVASIPPAPVTSLEARAFAAGDVRATYLGPGQLRLEGPTEGAALEHTYQTTNWANILDGLVVVREEHPTQPLAGDDR